MTDFEAINGCNRIANAYFGFKAVIPVRRGVDGLMLISALTKFANKDSVKANLYSYGLN